MTHGRRVPVLLRSLTVAALIPLTAAVLGSCGDAPLSPDATTSAFSGPWAEEFGYFDSSTESDFAHRAFADGVITDAEAQEGRSLIDACYANHGAVVTYDAYGYETVEVTSGNEDPFDVMGLCSLADGGVVVLHDQIRLNPDHLDQLTIQAACLVEHGIVQPGFTAQDLDQVYASEAAALPWEPGDETATACMVDPLGLATETA